MAETAVAQVGAGVAVATFLLTVAIGRWLVVRRMMVDRVQRFVGHYAPAGTRSRDIANAAPLTSRAARLRAFVAARRTPLLVGTAILVLLLASKIMLGWVLAGLLALGLLVALGWRRHRQQARFDQL